MSDARCIRNRIGLLVVLLWSITFLGCSPSTSPKNESGIVDSKSTDSAQGANGSQSTAPSRDSELSKEERNALSAGALNATGSESDQSAAAKQLLEKVITTYKNASTYQDEGVITIDFPGKSGPEGNERVQESRPLRVAFERPNRLAMQTLQVTSGWTPETFESIAGNEEYRPFDNQRLVRPLPPQVTMDWLLADHLDGVLLRRGIGVPLSLELLLEPQPLSDWIQRGEFRILEPDTFGQIPCQRIEIKLDVHRFVLWIDTAELLILRCDLPIESYFEMLDAEIDKSQSRFSIDFINARVGAPIDWGKWKLPRVSNEALVRRFIDPPPRNVLRNELGEIPEHFVLKDAKGNELLDTAQRKKPITLLQWIDDSDAARAFINDFYLFRKKLDATGMKGSVETFFVSAFDADRMTQAFSKWNCDLPFAIDANGQIASRCGVDRVFASVVIGKDGKIQVIDSITQFDRLLEQLVQVDEGVDLASRLKKMVLDDEARYASRLHRNIVDRDQIGNLSKIHQRIAPFELSFHDISMDWRCELENDSVAGTGETFPPFSAKQAISPETLFEKEENRYRVASLLDDLGNVIIVDQSGSKRTVASIPIERATDAIRIHVLPDPWTHQWVAIVPEGLPRFWHCVAPHINTSDYSPQEAVQTPLEEGETILGATWIFEQGKPRLWMTTSQGRLVEFDPSTQALNGTQAISLREPGASKSALRLVNIVPTLNNRGEPTGWNGIWNDQTVVKLELPDSKNETSMRPSQVKFIPEYGNWVWGRGQKGAWLVGLEKFNSGETGAVLMDSQFEPARRQALSVLPEQCKLLAATQTSDDRFYWLATAPNRVLHLQTIDGYPDQMSFGTRIYGATLIPAGKNLKLVVVLDREVSCWTLKPRLENP